MATKARAVGWILGIGLLALVAGEWTASVPGQELSPGQPDEESPQVLIGPYLQSVARNEATVRWETAGPSTGRLAWGANPECPLAAEEPGESTRHEIRLTGLSPATRYWYRIADPTSSVAGPFTTERNRASPLRVVVYGDDRTGHEAHAQVVAGAAASEPDFALNVGDLVESPSEDLWRTFFAIEAPLISRVPLFPALGNHEGDGERYLQLFRLPDEGTGHGRYYSMRWGLVAVLALDTQQSVAPGSLQYAWVEQKLAELAAVPDIVFTFCVLHHGPYCAASGHGSNLEVRSYLVPLFERYGVDIVFSGHDHVYERSTVNGVKYVVTGGGGAPLHPAGHGWWTEVSASVYEYCVLDIEGGSLGFTAFDAETGAVVDGFQLAKRTNECTGDLGCSDLAPRECPPGEVGGYRCVATTCVWDCTQAPPPPRVRRRLQRAS